MVKTRSASGLSGAGANNSNRRLKTTKTTEPCANNSHKSAASTAAASAAAATPSKTVSRGSQTMMDFCDSSSSSSRQQVESRVSLSELRRDLVGISAASSASAAEKDLIQPSTSSGIKRKRRSAAAGASSGTTFQCDKTTLSLSRDGGASSSSSKQHQSYPSNVRPHESGSKRKLNKKFLDVSGGEVSKKRRRVESSSEPEIVVLDEDDDESWSGRIDDDHEMKLDESVEEVDSEDEEEGFDDENPPGDRVAYIHVGEGGEADLEAQLKGAENLDIQILEEENLPDIDETDMIHGLDHTGTARDYVDERHRCTANCPVGCQGHLRPNEIVIYESFKWQGKLRGRRR